MSGTRADSAGERWESLRTGYSRDSERVPSGVPLHETADAEIGPVDYEVIRSKLWSANMDHMETIRRTSGSLVVVLGWTLIALFRPSWGKGLSSDRGTFFSLGVPIR